MKTRSLIAILLGAFMFVAVNEADAWFHKKSDDICPSEDPETSKGLQQLILWEMGYNDAMPLHMAAMANACNAAEEIIDSGVDVNVLAYNQGHPITPLVYAVKFNAVETAALLIAHDADVNANDSNRKDWILLDYAVRTGNEKMIALLQLHGAGCNKNCPKENEELKLRAEQGDADAQYNLGEMYNFNESVASGDKRALHWWRKAAEQGDARAQFRLGQVFYRVEQNTEQAKKWFYKSAEQGYLDAQILLADKFEYGGAGGPYWQMDRNEAVHWHLQAARQGHAKSLFKLGKYMYDSREERYVAEAYVVFSLAIEMGGSEDVRENEFGAEPSEYIDDLKENMSTEEIAMAQKRIAEWLQKFGAQRRLDSATNQ